MPVKLAAEVQAVKLAVQMDANLEVAQAVELAAVLDVNLEAVQAVVVLQVGALVLAVKLPMVEMLDPAAVLDLIVEMAAVLDLLVEMIFVLAARLVEELVQEVSFFLDLSKNHLVPWGP